MIIEEQDESEPEEESNTGVLIGIVVGSLAVIGLIIGIVYFVLRLRKQSSKRINRVSIINV